MVEELDDLADASGFWCSSLRFTGDRFWLYHRRMPQPYTSKQMGDACEMLVAAEMTLAGVPALKVPDNWPCYDIIAQPRDGRPPQRVSVKSRTFKTGPGTYVVYNARDDFDWLAIVLLNCADADPRRIFVIPRALADEKARRDKPTAKTSDERYWRQDEIPKLFAKYEENFRLLASGNINERNYALHITPH